MNELTASLKAFRATLSPQEQSELSSMERAAMIAETRDLLNKARNHKGDAMGSMNRRAQAELPIQQQQPSDKAGQQTVPEALPAAPQTPVQGQAALPPQVQPSTPIKAEPQTNIEQYVDEKEEQASEELSGDEMGLKEPAKIAAYVEAYGHLRIRPTVKNALEVFDPGTNATLMLIRPNTTTRKNAQMLRRCAVDVLASIAHHGLVKTAQTWRGQIKRAAGGVVDYGTNAMQVKPQFSDESINDRGETTMQQDIVLGTDTTTGEGDNLTTKDQPDTRQPAGLSGKAAAQGKAGQKVPEKGGILPGHETNMADAPAKSPEGNALSVLDNAESTMTEKHPKKDKGSDDTLENAVTTFANETLTANLRLAQMPQGEPPMSKQLGGCGGFEPNKQPSMPVEDEKTAQGVPGTPPPPPAQLPQTAQEQRMTCPDCDGAGCPRCLPYPKKGQEEMAPAPGMGADVLPQDDAVDPTMMTDEQKIAHLYRKRAEKQVAENTRKFIARFVRCLRVAARRQALNLEPNQLKIAVADALMTEAALSKHEVYMPMDARTATFVIERGLDQRNALSFVDSLIKRSAAFMKMSDEALTQVEDDLENIQPVAPAAPPVKDAQMSNPTQPSVMPSMPQMAAEPDPSADMVPGADGTEMPVQADDNVQEDADPGVMGQPSDMELDNPMMDEQQRAAATRRRAAGGNLPINTGVTAASTQVPSNDKRDRIRFAVSATKNASLHNYFGGKR
jgi:hypothetical protein